MFSPSWGAPADWYIGRLYEGGPNVVPDYGPLMRMSHPPTVPFTNLCGFNRLLRWPQHKQASKGTQFVDKVQSSMSPSALKPGTENHRPSDDWELQLWRNDQVWN